MRNTVDAVTRQVLLSAQLYLRQPESRALGLIIAASLRHRGSCCLGRQSCVLIERHGRYPCDQFALEGSSTAAPPT